METEIIAQMHETLNELLTIDRHAIHRISIETLVMMHRYNYLSDPT